MADVVCEEKEVPVFARRCISSTVRLPKAGLGACHDPLEVAFRVAVVADAVCEEKEVPVFARRRISSIVTFPKAGLGACHDPPEVAF
jgi:hypothetical protein